MRKNCLLILSMIALCFSASAQTDSTAKKPLKKITGTVKISPFDFVASTFTLGVETKVGTGASLQFYPSLILNEREESYYYSNGNYASNTKTVGGAAELQFKKFVYTRVAPLDGVYVGIFAKYLHLESERDVFNSYNYPYPGPYPGPSDPIRQKYELNQYSGGVIGGYQWIISQTLVLEAYVGGGVKLSEDKFSPENLSNAGLTDNVSVFYNNNSGVFPKAGFKIGVTF